MRYQLVISLDQFTKVNGNLLIQFLDQLYQCFTVKEQFDVPLIF